MNGPRKVDGLIRDLPSTDRTRAVEARQPAPGLLSPDHGPQCPPEPPDERQLACRREYSRKLSLYRKRDWSCQLTGKAGLTYEEALVSEARAKGLIKQVGGLPMAPPSLPRAMPSV